MSKYIPGFETTTPLQALTTLIHQTGIIHGVDHLSLYDYVSKDYGCTSMRVPFHSFEDTDFWRKFCQEKNISLAEIVKNPEKYLINSSDVLRTRIFADTFENFLDGGHDYHSMLLLDTDYKVLPSCYVKQFKEELLELDAELFDFKHKMVPGLDKDDFKTRDMRPPGLRIVPVTRMIKSVCM